MLQGERIGTLIGKIRTEKNYRRKDLSAGLCSEQMLTKIENGERIPDKALLEYIVQRLDLTIEYMEMIISLEEYNQIQMHDEIIEFIFNGKLDNAKVNLEEYRKNYRLTKIQEQFVKRCEAYLSIYENEHQKKTLELFMEAINITLPEWKEELDQHLLSTVEVELLINIGEYYIKVGQCNLGEALLVKISEYVRIHKKNEYERVKLLPRCAILLSRYLGEKINSEILLDWLIESYELLRNQGVLYYMVPVLNDLCRLYEQQGRQEDAKKISQQLAAIKEVASHVNMDKYNELLPFYIWSSPIYYIDCEMIREARIIKKMTQEDLAEGIYKNPESLSRIETGKVAPKKTQFYQLISKVNIDKARYNTIVLTNNYKTLEEYDKFTWSIVRKGQSERAALQLPIDIEDVRFVANEQRIVFHDLSHKLARNEITIEECIKQAVEILEKTYIFDEKNLRVPMDTELLLINKIAICFEQQKEYEKAIQIYEHVISCFKNSRVSEKYYKKSIQMIMYNLSDCYEKKLEYRKSFNIMRNCIVSDIKIGRGHKLGNFYSTYIHLRNICEGRDDKVEEFQSSLQLLELYKKEREKSILENICKRISEK